METGSPPPPNVLRAFGVAERTELIPLAGGISQSAWRAGSIVLKPVQDFNPGEGDWIATVLDVIVEDGFRVVKPVRADDGRWLEDGWTAWHWIEGHHERTRWHAVVEAAAAFHQALNVAVAEVGADPRPTWLDTRNHRWAIAEGVVWRDDPLPAVAVYDVPEWELWERLRAAGPPLREAEAARSQVVHGDMGGNVLVGTDGVPTFIDMSPGWRPARSAEVQVLAEAVAFRGADYDLLDAADRADICRTFAFRLLCGLQMLAQVPGSILPAEDLGRIRRALDLLGA